MTVLVPPLPSNALTRASYGFELGGYTSDSKAGKQCDRDQSAQVHLDLLWPGMVPGRSPPLVLNHVLRRAGSTSVASLQDVLILIVCRPIVVNPASLVREATTAPPQRATSAVREAGQRAGNSGCDYPAASTNERMVPGVPGGASGHPPDLSGLGGAGERNVAIDNICRIAWALGVEPADLITQSGRKK